MDAFRVFNQNNVLVEVSTQELDAAATGAGALSTHLANAAGVAARRDLIPRLRATLAVPERRNKLAAARSLLALGDEHAAAALRDAAAREEDAITVNIFRALALRFEGVDSVRRAFAGGDDEPALSGALASIYSGSFTLTPADADFLIEAIECYLAGEQSWIKRMNRDEWKSDLHILVHALARAPTRPWVGARARDALARVVTSRAERDTKKEAQKLLDGG